MGRSFSPNFKCGNNFGLPFSEHNPSADTNSVKKTSGLPVSTIICLNAISVTSAIGAKTKKGFLSCFQKFIIKRGHGLATVPFVIPEQLVAEFRRRGESHLD